MGFGQAFGELWPVLTAVGGGYAGLLLIIRKLFEDRLREKDATIAEKNAEIVRLRERLDRREEYVWRSLTATEASTALAHALAAEARP